VAVRHRCAIFAREHDASRHRFGEPVRPCRAHISFVRENEREPFDALSHRTPALRSEIRSTVFASVTKVCVSCAQSDGRILSAAPARAASGLSTSSRTADSRFLASF
jgi:hypothetical protein